MRQWLQRGDYTAIIVEQDGLPVAYALYRDEPAAIHLRHFFVDRRYRRHGLGRRAMALLLDQHWPAGKRVTVDVLIDNAAGRAFWLEVGFRDYAISLELMRSSCG